jgi:ABC-2 type transport system permease protein
MTAAVVLKYVAFFRVSAAEARRERGELYGRVVFFAVILGVFSSLWHAVGEAGMPLAADPKALVWYLAVTEWIVLSAPPVHTGIQEAVRRGDIACQLGRPVSYVGAAFAEGLGLLAIRTPVLGVTACVCAFVFTGWMPPPRVLACVVLFGLVGAALITAVYLLIGLLAFWLEDVSPVYWVCQKLLFVLGGLMLPIELYPDFIRRAAAFTPFPAALSGPASFVLARSSAGAGVLACNLAIWAYVTALALWWVFRRATSALTFNGG